MFFVLSGTSEDGRCRCLWMDDANESGFVVLNELRSKVDDVWPRFFKILRVAR